MTVDRHQLSQGGPVVVLAHGLEDNWQSWTPVAQLLAPHYELIALDLPWRTGNDYTWRADGTPGQWLERALSPFGQPIHGLVAHSFGANAALELLSTAPVFERAALLAPLYHPGIDDDVRSASQYALESAVRSGLRLKLGDRKIAPGVVAMMERKLLDYVMPRAFPSFFEYLVTCGDLELSEVTVETLVLSGTTDVSLPPSSARALARAMPAARVRQRPGYTHFCHLEQTVEVAAELTEFLRAPA